MSVSRSFRALGGLAAVFAAACSETSTGPGTITDPVATQAALAAVDSAFAAPAAVSFGALGPFITPTGRSAAATMVGATAPQPPVAGQDARAFAAARLGDLRLLASLSPTAPQGPIIPDALYGSVFTWDSAAGHYVRAPTGGPANGVRFILYAVNPITHAITYPLTEVGYVDLLDESANASLKLHILVKGVGGTPTYIDYLATVTPGAGQVTATVSGFISNGATGGDNKTLTFNVTATLALSSADVNASFALNNPSVTIQLHVTSVRSIEGQETVTVDFTITHPGETIHLQGLFENTEGVLDTLNAEVRVNGQLFATVAGNALGVTFYDKNGNVIENTEQQHEILQVLRHLLDLAEDVFEFIEDLFDPVEHFLGG